MPLPRLSITERAHEQACNDVHYHHDRACKELGQLFSALGFIDHDHEALIGHLSDLLGDVTFTDVEQF